MKGYRDSRVTGARFGLVMLTGILALGARPGAAPGSEATQAPDTTRMTLILPSSLARPRRSKPWAI